IASNPIENHLVPRTVNLNPDEKQARLRITPTGHSFGGNQNCAEFCQKNYQILLNNNPVFSQLMWRNDCGMNPLMHQAGTWLYDRSNWCPGEKAITRIHELTPLITPGSNFNIDMNIDAYSYTGGASFNPNYIIEAQMVTYGDPAFLLDATVEDIIAPNNDFNYSRFNPICNNPTIAIKNNGSTPLTSLDINYGIKGGTLQQFNWTGTLNFLQTATVNLGSMTWGSVAGTPDIFEVIVSNPNGQADEYATNDTMRSKLNFTNQFPTEIVLVLRTNSTAYQTSWQLKDDLGNIIAQATPGSFVNNNLYRDTLILQQGCYDLTIHDQGKNGLAFFANNEGTGFARIQKADGTSAILKNFEADFGTMISHRFTVGYTTHVQEINNDIIFNAYPNPATDKIHFDISLPKNEKLIIRMYNMEGKLKFEKEFDSSIFPEISLDEFSSGIYYISCHGTNWMKGQKIIILR
ncbi:MAG: T9SS type A sorting domain-containing protein, partial [Bacteroidetes bacterium]|nr:T9SS type A sorting domain-containing protein [Bacteroidota bacterium]